MNNEKKYHPFYRSFKNCILQTNDGNVSCMEGALEIEIKQFEQRHQMTFPLAFRVALLYFGRKMAIDGEISMTMQFTLLELERVLKRATALKLKSVIQRLAKATVYLDNGSWTEVPVETVLALENLLFIHYDYDRNGYMLMDASLENPVVFFLLEPEQVDGEELGEIITDGITFTTFIRGLLFVHVFDLLNPRKESGQYLSSCESRAKVKWLSEYPDLIVSHHPSFRRQFCKKIQAQEQQDGVVLTIDEFEWAFINYMKAIKTRL